MRSANLGPSGSGGRARAAGPRSLRSTNAIVTKRAGDLWLGYARTMLRLVVAFLVASATTLPSAALAHLSLTAPVSRYGPDVLKTGPCGVAGGERSANVSYFEPGETIEVRWEEYVQHPGHYRIAFDPDGVDDFVDPVTMTELYSNDAVLLDGIEDSRERQYAVTVTLPEVSCDNCTLQVIQVMYDKPPYTTPGNDIYYQCADLVLASEDAPDGGPEDPDAGSELDAGMETVADASVNREPDAGGNGAAEPGGSGCRAVRSTDTAAWWSILILVWMLRRLARVHRFPL